MNQIPISTEIIQMHGKMQLIVLRLILLAKLDL